MCPHRSPGVKAQDGEAGGTVVVPHGDFARGVAVAQAGDKRQCQLSQKRHNIPEELAANVGAISRLVDAALEC